MEDLRRRPRSRSTARRHSASGCTARLAEKIRLVMVHVLHRRRVPCIDGGTSVIAPYFFFLKKEKINISCSLTVIAGAYVTCLHNFADQRNCKSTLIESLQTIKNKSKTKVVNSLSLVWGCFFILYFNELKQQLTIIIIQVIFWKHAMLFLEPALPPRRESLVFQRLAENSSCLPTEWFIWQTLFSAAVVSHYKSQVSGWSTFWQVDFYCKSCACCHWTVSPAVELGFSVGEVWWAGKFLFFFQSCLVALEIKLDSAVT